MEVEAAKILAEAIASAVNGIQISILGWSIVYASINLKRLIGHD